MRLLGFFACLALFVSGVSAGTIIPGLYPKSPYVYVVDPSQPFPAMGTLSGSLSVGSGLNAYSMGDTGSISWEIGRDSDNPNVLRYTYTLTGLSKGLSHFALNVSAGFSAEFTFGEGQEAGDIEGPGPFYEPPGNNADPQFTLDPAIKINTPEDTDYKTFTVSFTADRMPVWGSIFAKFRQGGIYNTGLNLAGYDDNAANGFLDVLGMGETYPTEFDPKSIFIPVPNAQRTNGQDIVPEPISIASWIGLMGVGGLVARRRNRG